MGVVDSAGDVVALISGSIAVASLVVLRPAGRWLGRRISAEVRPLVDEVQSLRTEHRETWALHRSAHDAESATQRAEHADTTRRLADLERGLHDHVQLHLTERHH